MSLRWITVACGVLGVGLMLPFHATITLVLGVTFMFSFVVCGVFLIAEPGFLEGDEADN